MSKILVIEDDGKTVHLLKHILENNQHTVDIAINGKEAIKQIDTIRYDLIVIDLILPIINGIQILQYLRASDIQTPTIVLTNEIDIDTELICYKEGTHNFHRKPINPRLLLFQINNITKDSSAKTRFISYKNVVIDKYLNELLVNGKRAHISQKELSLLSYLLNNANRLVTKRELAYLLYEEANDRRYRNLDTLVHRLRVRLNSNYGSISIEIETARGIGYRII